MGSLAWKLLGAGSAAVAAGFADRGVRAAWKLATGDEPPPSPEDPDTSWGEAVAWALVSGAAVAVVRLAVTRRAAGYYRRSTGELPKALRRG